MAFAGEDDVLEFYLEGATPFSTPLWRGRVIAQGVGVVAVWLWQWNGRIHYPRRWPFRVHVNGVVVLPCLWSKGAADVRWRH